MTDETDHYLLNLRNISLVRWRQPPDEALVEIMLYEGETEIRRIGPCSRTVVDDIEAALAHGDASIRLVPREPYTGDLVLVAVARPRAAMAPPDSKEPTDEVVRLEHDGGFLEIRRSFIVAVDAQEVPRENLYSEDLDSKPRVIVRTSLQGAYTVTAKRALSYFEPLHELYDRVCASIGWRPRPRSNVDG